MRSLMILAAAALIAAASSSAFAQEPADDDAPKPIDPAQSQAIDSAYRTRCEASVPKELCTCVIGVANSQIAQPSERQIFFDYMMGDVEKAKSARANFSPRKSMEFGAALQKSDLLLGQQCDRFKPQPKEQPAGGAAAPKPN